MNSFFYPVRDSRVLLTAALLLLLPVAGCNRKADSSADSSSSETTGSAAGPQTVSSHSSSPPKPRPTALPVPAEIWKEFSGEKALAEVKKQIDFGPRPSGSAEIEKARAAISESLAASGWDIEPQPFTAETPRGTVKFVNLIARFSATTARPAPATTQTVIVASHFDTKRFSTIKFVGASDGASSTGALVELARVLALDPVLASKVELLFFDGEEAFTQFTETDGLYGSRHYATQLRDTQRAAQFKFGILWDMIGDKELTITLSADSPQPLTEEILLSAEALGLRKHFGYYNRSILDDHEPLLRLARIPTVDLIDFDYLPWHTADDTFDKLSPESLRKIGAVTLFHLRKALGK
ncbi:MAG: Peptidase [Chthoniobacteraceae bacterium]|nr:Peptidase [Chthoniobacteraceae bacterium]